ncbi:ketopantoate reductase family protein [Methanoplanus sp. FWC-SCC4]|uniref:2-dehydropantoate 2-reductase n=1 Tax=Methanochimaera problematica TaxID=2609417 RepID=A0AA97FCH2_9EURY|nr:ketopantoate reductase family protein [Methanoplanus sp. FWC-SCC4]WOF15693.1 ketopantoate reductase family protein [Methanoplanus sp. FWC-SCC4]
MKIAVLGAGAVGLSVAAMLSKVCDVYAVCRKRHADAVKKRGFVMTGIWGEEKFTFPCSEQLPKDEKFDYIIITSKSTATRGICEQFKDYLKDTEVISLQNGIGNEEIISEYTDKVIGGMIITGFEWRDDAYVHVSVQASPIKLGRFPKGTDEAVTKIVDLFKTAGMEILADENITGSLWGKTLYNSALNPLGAIMKVPYGNLLDQNAWNIIEEIVKEAFLVCNAEGVKLAWNKPEDYLEFLHENQLPSTAGHHSSMYQDLEFSRKTEIDFINGAIVAKGKNNGIKTPVNKTIVNLIKFKEDLILSK